MCGIPTKQCLMKTRVPAASNHSLGTESKHINLYGPAPGTASVVIAHDQNQKSRPSHSRMLAQLLS